MSTEMGDEKPPLVTNFANVREICWSFCGTQSTLPSASVEMKMTFFPAHPLHAGPAIWQSKFLLTEGETLCDVIKRSDSLQDRGKHPHIH